MNYGLDTDDSDNLMMQRPAIFCSGINKHMPNRPATVRLDWMTLFSIVICFLLTVREGQMFQPHVEEPAGKQ